MIKYSVMYDKLEFDPTIRRDILEIWRDSDDICENVLDRFDTMEDAVSYLNSIEQKYIGTHRCSYRLAYANILFIEIAEYELDEDGEWEFVDGVAFDEFRFKELDD